MAALPESVQLIIWIAGLVGGGTGFGFVVSWRISEIRIRDREALRAERHDVRAAFEQRTVALDEKINIIKEGYEKRIQSIELQNASTIVILEHMDGFRTEVKGELDRMQVDRRADMEQITTRLNALQNLNRFNQLSMEGARDGR